MSREVAPRGFLTLRLRAAALAFLALLAFLPPAFVPHARAGGEAGGFQLIICTADGMIVLTQDEGGEPAPAPDQHDLSCLACLLRLGSPPPGLAAAIQPPAAAHAPAIFWAAADAAPRDPPHLRPFKTGPPPSA